MSFPKILALAVATSFTLLGTPTLAGSSGIHNFSMTFDGSTTSLDLGSSDPNGVVLFPNDVFTVDLHTAGPNDLWQVTAPVDQFFPLSFAVNEAGQRTANAATRFELDGTEVFAINEPGVAQEEVHVGAQHWALPAGLKFDKVFLEYELLSSTTASTTISTTFSADLFNAFGSADRPIFRHPDVVYTTVPEPTSLALLGLGTWLAACRMRRR